MKPPHIFLHLALMSFRTFDNVLRTAKNSFLLKYIMKEVCILLMSFLGMKKNPPEKTVFGFLFYYIRYFNDSNQTQK